MIDLFNIPNSQQDVQIFYTNGTTNAWQTWQKPRKCNYIYIICIGSGTGGAGGLSNWGNNSGSPGSGGFGGAVTRVLYNSNLIPDILFVQVGVGGIGGSPRIFPASTSTAGNGNRSFVSILPNTTPTSLVCVSGNAAGSHSGGTAETVATTSSATFLSLGNFISTPGILSSTQLLQQPTNTLPLTSQITSGGAAGAIPSGGTLNFSGGSISSTSLSPLILGGSSDGGNGGNGYTSWKPFFSTGGAGGGSSISGVGGNGGNGGIGSGGGNGGTTAFGSSGGIGGKGGDGLVIIISF